MLSIMGEHFFFLLGWWGEVENEGDVDDDDAACGFDMREDGEELV